jgi:hypothetical protein
MHLSFLPPLLFIHFSQLSDSTPSRDTEALLDELKLDRQVRQPRYILTTKEVDRLPDYAIAEHWVTESSLKLVSEWKRAESPTIEALPIDLLRCDIDFTKSETVADLERINDGQAAHVSRAAFLVDSTQSRTLVGELLENAKAITHHLQRASQLFVDAPSRLAQCEQELVCMRTHATRLGQFGASISAAVLPGFERIGGTAAFAAQLAAWVAARTAAPMHNVALRYRASEHGWKSADFHRTCDNVPRLLLIARSTSGDVFGGFTSVGFGGGNYTAKVDDAAFVFTLINPHGIAPTMLPSKSGNSFAVQQVLSHGALFGRGSDLCFCSNCNTSASSYSNPGTSYTDTTGKGSALFTGAYQLGTMAEILAYSV